MKGRSALRLSAAMALVLAATVAADAEPDRSRLISLSSGAIDVTRPAAVPEHLSAAASTGSVAPATEVVLVKFPGPVTAAQYAALEAAAVRIYTYLPHDSYLVRMPAKRLDRSGRRALARLGASWTGAYHPAYKVSPAVSSVAALPEDDEAALRKAGKDPLFRPVLLQVYPDADVNDVVRQIQALGIKGVVGFKAGAFFSRVRLLLSTAEIARHRDDLARLADVFWIDLEPRRVLLNDTTVWVGQSGLSGGQTTPVFTQGIFGEGQTIAVLDTGIDPDMCWFRDPARGLPPTNACNGGTVVDNAQRKVIAVDFLWSSECAGGISSTEWDTQDHGSHVAGTAAGDNFANLLLHDTADGMAPGAKLVMQDAGYLVDNCGDLPGIGCPVVDLNPIFQQTYNQGARIHTNSWGDNENAAVQNNYSAGSQDVDEFMWNNKDFLIFFAAGNAGPGTATVGSPSTNKNGVSVGATLRGTSAESMASFSSCGPTSDSRIKPDITVPGNAIISANNDLSTTTNNCGTKSSSGTSMAAPGGAGLAALIRQYYVDGWYPTGGEVSINGFTPSAALVKATLISSAKSMTGTTAIPANCQGWGRVLLEDALFFTGQPRKLWVKDNAAAFNTGSSNEDRAYTFTLTAGQPLKATLAWTDRPSTPAASIHLINDLDLIVSGPGGTTWRGNVFASGQSAAGGSADRRNNLEQVLLNAPAAGVYTVTVRSFTVPNGPQPFALVVTGNVSEGAGNVPPIANAGPDQGVGLNAAVTLNGSGSSDPDAGPGPLTYAWSQVSGPAVTISNATQAQASFTPTVTGTYVFQLQVSDGAASATDQVTVTAATGPVTVFFDNFETNLGWTVNPSATDTATTGQWQRADPATTTSSGTKQLGTTVSGTFDLVTGASAGLAAGDFDLDGGVTTIRSPAITLPASGTLTLTFSYYLAHGTNASTADFLRVRVVGTTTSLVLEELGAANNDDAVWAASPAINISAFAGQSVRILIEAADASTASLVEAAVDDVRITQQ
jgi:Subtilase family